MKQIKEELIVRYIRFYTKVYHIGLKTLSKIMYLFLRVFLQCDIPPTTEIGKGLHLPHYGMGICIAPRTIIGKNVTIYQRVTIGVKYPGQYDRPIIGDNVLIGTGSVILGGVRIGNCAKIGANAVVVKDIPENSTVIGIPARLVQ